MERLTPRTPKAACFQSASQSALRVHDAAIGKGGVVHLFRFEPEFEQALQTMTSIWDESGLPTFCDSSEEAKNFLSSLASTTPKVAGTSTGPSHIGRADEWASSAAHARMAGVYLAAFRSGTPAFPYFA